MKEAIGRAKAVVQTKANALAANAHVHASHHWVHLGYSTFVFIEGHGLYAIFGGLLGVYSIIGIIAKETEH